MRTLQDIQAAIARLSPHERRSLAMWLHGVAEQGWRVEETASAYVVAPKSHLLSAEEYLAIEEASAIKHEYVAGYMYAMSGVSDAHNTISLNLATTFRAHLRGGPCKTFMSDIKVHVSVGPDQLFYYPDVIVDCGPHEADSRYKKSPRLIVEVLSPSTARVDRREKALAYREIPALEEYMLVAQDRPEVTIQRRAEGWQPLVLTSSDAVAELRSIDLSLPLALIYEGSGVV